MLWRQIRGWVTAIGAVLWVWDLLVSVKSEIRAAEFHPDDDEAVYAAS